MSDLVHSSRSSDSDTDALLSPWLGACVPLPLLAAEATTDILATRFGEQALASLLLIGLDVADAGEKGARTLAGEVAGRKACACAACLWLPDKGDWRNLDRFMT